MSLTEATAMPIASVVWALTFYLPRWEFARRRAAAKAGHDWCVKQLFPGIDRAEQQTSSAHVAAADKRLGKDEAGAERLMQNRHIFIARNAAQKHGPAGWRQCSRQRQSVAR